MLFFDGTHRALLNSDVSTFFLDVLPMLVQGVHVHLHDIWLPYDYPPEWRDRGYSEQYLLAVLLLGGAAPRVMLPNAFIGEDPELLGLVDPILGALDLLPVRSWGTSFWMQA